MIVTLFTIAGITFAAMLLLFAVAIFLPLTIQAEFAVSGKTRNGKALLIWIHPRMVRFLYDINRRTGELTIAGWKRIFMKEEARPAREETPPREGTEGATAARNRFREESRGEEVAPGAVKQSRTKAAEGDAPVERSAPESETGNEGARPQPLSLWRKIRKTWTVIRDRRIVARLFRWSVRVARLCFRLIRFDHFRLHAKVGMDDPEELGRMYGWYASLNDCFFRTKKSVDIRFEPLFFSDELELEGSIGFRTSMARLLLPIAVGLATFPYITSFFTWRRLRKVYR